MRVIQITKLYFYFIPSKVATLKKAMKLRLIFYVHVAVHRYKFLYNKTD